MTEAQRSFVPAAGHDWLLPLYDPLQTLLGGESAKRQLLEQAAVGPGQRVLDIGCGTGDLLVLVVQIQPGALATGLDPDPKALARAKRKLERAGVIAPLDRGFSDELAYPEASFDRVLSSFMFHHLESDEKRKTLREVARVLKPGGSLHLLDFGGSGPGQRGRLARLLHSGDSLRENLEGRIPQMMADAGLAEPCEVAHRRTIFGRIAYYRAYRAQRELA